MDEKPEKYPPRVEDYVWENLLVLILIPVVILSLVMALAVIAGQSLFGW